LYAVSLYQTILKQKQQQKKRPPRPNTEAVKSINREILKIPAVIVSALSGIDATAPAKILKKHYLHILR
jgi:hypothetical protein